MCGPMAALTASAVSGATQVAGSVMKLGSVGTARNAAIQNATAERMTAERDARMTRLRASIDNRWAGRRAIADDKAAWARADAQRKQGDIYLKQSRREIEAGEIEAQRTVDQGKRLRGRQINEFIGNGIQIDGTVDDVIADSAREVSLDVAAIKYSAAIRADNYLDQAEMARDAAIQTRAAADETYAMATEFADEQMRLTDFVATGYEATAASNAARKIAEANRAASTARTGALFDVVGSAASAVTGYNNTATKLASMKF